LVLHDARAVRDTAGLRFAKLGDTWILAKVDPSSHSGAGFVPGAQIDGATGQLHAPPDAQVHAVKRGTWRSVLAAKPTAPAEGQYSWSEPAVQKRQAEPEDVYSVFERGGTILFQPQPEASGAGYFSEVHVVFPAWSVHVREAARLEAHLSLNGAKIGKAEAAELGQALSQQNPLIRIMAFRQLLSSGNLTAELARRTMGASQGNERSVFTYLLLTSPQASSAVEDEIQASHDPVRLKAIALGAFSASLFRGSDSEIGGRSRAVMKLIHRAGLARDSYTAVMLERMGLQP